MNQRGVDVLVAAALSGRRQLRNHLFSADGGRCAMGFLAEGVNMLGSTFVYLRPCLEQIYGLRENMICPEANGSILCCSGVLSEISLIVHLNDCHQWDLLKIARTLAVPETAL